MAKFDDLLEELFQLRGLQTAVQKQNYIVSLKDVARNLWRSYQDDEIVVDYNDLDIQIVYLIRYFLFYSDVIHEELIPLSEGNDFPLLRKPSINLSLFCSGALPEGLGVSYFLSDYNNGIQNLNINTFDLNVLGWENVRNIIKDTFIDHVLPNCHTAINPIVYDLRVDISEPHLQLIEDSDLIVFQNCLNEITVADGHVFEVSIRKIFDRMPINCCVVIIERQGYINVTNLINSIIGISKEYNCHLLINGKSEKTTNNSYLKKRILGTVCGQLFESFNPNPDGLVLSPGVKYCSYFMKKLPI